MTLAWAITVESQGPITELGRFRSNGETRERDCVGDSEKAGVRKGVRE